MIYIRPLKTNMQSLKNDGWKTTYFPCQMAPFFNPENPENHRLTSAGNGRGYVIVPWPHPVAVPNESLG